MEGTRGCERQIVKEVADPDRVMRAITNDYKDAQILNLGSEGEHGPYLVTQTGVAPGDPRSKTCTFVLRPDGHWVDFNAYACRPNPEAMDEIVFSSIPKIMETFGTLFGGPRVLDLPVDEVGLNAWIERHNNDPLQAVRAWVAQYKERRRKGPRRLKRLVKSTRDEIVAMSSFSLARWIPALTWLRAYDRSWLRRDVLAGITLGAYLLPAALGDASLANLPPQAGLYACLFAGLVFWIFCSSRQTVVSVTSAISLVVGSSLGELTGGNLSRFATLAAATALLVAVTAFIAWLVKAGVLVHFISESVMTGFKCGVALFLASTQLPKLFGFHSAHGSFWENSDFFFRHLSETNSMSILIGGIALTLLVIGKIFLKHKPVALFIVIGGIVAASVFSLNAYGVKLIGAVPPGIPPLQLPAVSWDDLNNLLPLAFACFLLGAVETAAVGRMFAAKSGGRFDANQENLALAGSNLLAGLGGGFPVSGGTSQSLVNESGGARTPLSTAFASLVILIVVLFFSHLLSALPQPILAAVVLAAVASLFKISTLKELWRSDRQEFAVAVAAFIGVLTFGLLRGVMIGAAISIIQLAHASAHPHIAVLGRIPGTRRFSDCDRHPDNEVVPGVMIFRPESSLIYFNIDNVSDLILSRVLAQKTLPALVVVDLSAAPRVDLQSAHALAAMADELTSKGIRFQAVEERSSVRDRLRHEGLDRRLGGVSRFTSVADVIDHFLNETEKCRSDLNSVHVA